MKGQLNCGRPLDAILRCWFYILGGMSRLRALRTEGSEDQGHSGQIRAGFKKGLGLLSTWKDRAELGVREGQV